MTTSLLPNNKLPHEFKYETIYAVMSESDIWKMAVGNHTFAFVNDSVVHIEYYGSHIVTLFRNGDVLLTNRGYKTQSTKKRLDLALKPLGKRLISRNYRWYIYTVATGEMNAFYDGVVVGREE